MLKLSESGCNIIRWLKSKFNIKNSLKKNFKFNNGSLRRKLLISNFIIILVVLLLSTSYMVYNSTSNAKEEIKNNLKSQSISSNIILNNEINNIDSINEIIVKNNSTITLIQLKLTNQLGRYFEDFKSKNKNIHDIVTFGDSGLLYSTNEKLNKLGESFFKQKKSIKGLYSIDNDIYIISSKIITTSDDKFLGITLMAQNIMTNLDLIKNISGKLYTTT